MDSKWRVLDFTSYEGKLSYTRGKIVAEEKSVPLADVDFILVGDKCTWGSGLVAGLQRFDVAMAICDWRNVPISVVHHWSTNTKVFSRHQAQADLSVPRAKNAWMRIIKAKIAGQAAVLEAFGETAGAKELQSLAKKVRSGDPANVEAQAARIYWPYFLGRDWSFLRNQDGGDLANGMLNYGYTILRGRVLTRIVATGLSPTLSLFHRNRSNTFVLADDIIEPFRPAVDAAVWRLISDGATELDTAEKAKLAGILAEKPDDSSFTMRSLIEDFCQEYALYVLGERESLSVPQWSISSEVEWDG